MDLRIATSSPTAAERAALDGVLGSPVLSWQGAERDDASLRHHARPSGRRDLLLPALHALQDRVGWISRGGLDEVCRRLGVAPADAYGVASFYGLLSLDAPKRRVLHVCNDLACMVAGSIVPPATTTTAVHDSLCLGLCELAPAALLIEAGEQPCAVPIGAVTPSALTDLAAGASPRSMAEPGVPQAGDPALVLLRRVGVVDATSLDDYRAHGGYQALARALDMGATAVVEAVEASGLVGRGGAAFPTGRKWAAVASQPALPHYVVANGDESEPGTFKDRVLMEGDPFAVVEAMTVAGFAVGAEKGYLYVRGEYPVAWARLQGAVATARRAGLLGPDIMSRGVAFDIELRKGAGAYICGEETAIFASIEGYRGEPRPKPPFPVEVGLFGQPTLVNNIETLVNVLPVLLDGPEAFAATGTAQSKGTKLFCLSGSVTRPGVYEVPFGPTIRELVTLAGGLAEGREVQAVLLGGAAGTFATPADLDVPLTMEGVRTIGASLGSGVVLVLDDTVDLVPLVIRIATFFRDESCGQCVPCRLGTARQVELLRRATDGDGAALPVLDDVGRAMRDASICGLGQMAYNAVESAVTRLRLFGAPS
ncbi:MAG TPA: NADH-ubiquinone oxidoreductase-F iron-sulfur binding region domain-containing protein [Acidimicrobiales bacterium]